MRNNSSSRAIQSLKQTMAELLEQATGVAPGEAATLGEMHRQAMDLRLPLEKDWRIGTSFIDYCHALEETDERYVRCETSLDLVEDRPVLWEWLREGMSPLTYFVDSTEGSTSVELFEFASNSYYENLGAPLLLGNLTIAEFSRALADLNTVSRLDISDWSRLGQTIPGLFDESNWPNLLPGQFSTDEDWSRSRKPVIADIIPTMVLLQTFDQALYQRAESFFYIPHAEAHGKLYPIFSEMHDNNVRDAFDIMVDHLYGGWSSPTFDKPMLEILTSGGLFSITNQENLSRWRPRVQFVVQRAVQAQKENPDLKWPYYVARIILNSLRDELAAGGAEERQSMIDGFLAYPGFKTLIDAPLETLIKQCSPDDLFHSDYSSDFLAHIDPEARHHMLLASIPRIARTTKNLLKKNNYPLKHHQVISACANVAPDALAIMGEALRTQVTPQFLASRFKSRYSTLIWFQVQGLQGRDNEKAAIEYCQAMPTAEMKAIAAEFLKIPIQKLSLDEGDAEIFLQRDLGL